MLVGRRVSLAATALVVLMSCASDDGRATGDVLPGGDVDVHVAERAPSTRSGPTVLFLHGASFDADVWVRTGILDDVAAAGSRAVAIDLPGFGLTPPSDLAPSDFLASLIDNVDDGLGVVVVSPSMSGTFSLALIASIGSDAMAGYVAVAPVGIVDFAASLPEPVDDLDTLIVWGSDDNVINIELADVLAGALPKHDRVVIEDAGHAAYQDQPEAFTTALMAFVGNLGSAGNAPSDGANVDTSATTVPATTPPAAPPPTTAVSVDPTEATGGVDGPVIYMRNNTEAETALAIGTLQMVNGCLGLESSDNEDDSSFVLVVWVYGTTWNPADSTMTFSGSKVRIGEQLELGGGEHSRDQLGHFVTDPAALEHIDQCLTELGTDSVFVNQFPTR